MEIYEFEIPVPWGHVAVKAWGNEENTPVLAVHGLGDNAGTFDRLLPFLPTSFYYICIDLPSHGKSSHYPPHLFISALDNVLTIKLVADHLNRKKYIFMGHSWGGQAGVLFTQLYPEYVFKLIVFDSFYLFPVSLHHFKDYLTDRFESLIRINKNVAKNNQRLYTYEEAVTKLIGGRLYGELFRESAEALVKRAIIPAEGGKFRFSTDPRLKVFINPLFDMRYVIGLLRKYPITCPSLFICASDSEAHFYHFKRVAQELQKNKRCVIKTVTGSHDVHNNSPEIVGPIVSKFLLNVKTKAWGHKQNTPVLMVHGFRDNAGSFDRLIPNLSNKFFYICIDLPGHGKSSHFPPHLLVHTINNILTYKIILDYLNTEKYIIVGHSWGGQMALLFTQLYPEYVMKLIILDALYLYPTSLDYFKERMRKRFDQLTQINQKLNTRAPPAYSYEEVFKRLVQSRIYGKLTKEAAEAILKRSVVAVGNGKFQFSGDIRTPITVDALYGEHFLNSLTKRYPITCPVLFIISSDSSPLLQYFESSMLETQKSDKCCIRKVEGDHNVHMNQPEVVAPIISTFLSCNSKL